MIPPKEKAEQIFYKMQLDWACDSCHNTFQLQKHDDWAKQCALIAVDELIKEQTMWQNGEPNPVLYWQQVKQEIENL